MNVVKTALWIGIGLATVALIVPGLLPSATGFAAVPAAPTSASVPLYLKAGFGYGETPYNLSTTPPTWNSGSLCSVVTVGSNLTCQNSPPSSCSMPQTYNFSGNSLTINIEIQGSPVCVLINIRGYHDTINLAVLGSGENGYWGGGSHGNRGDCHGEKGGYLAMAIYGEHDVLNANYTASYIQSWFYFYQDRNTYNFTSSGSHLETTTYFVGALDKFQICPAKNLSRSDRAHVSSTGNHNFQLLDWVNAVGYSTPIGFSPMPGTGHYNYMGRENTSGAFACGWVVAVTPHWGWDSHGGGTDKAVVRE
jgi:hypothetical protein